MVDLCVVILNYGTPRFALGCLSSVVPQIDDLDARVVLVDNNSPDDSLSILTDWIEKERMAHRVELVAVAENRGFSAGINRGIEHCSAHHYLLLNSDIVVREGGLQAMLKLLRSDESIGLVGPRFETSSQGLQEHAFRDYTAVSELLQNTGSRSWMKRFTKHTLFRTPFPKEPCDVSWFEFACVLGRQEVFADVGPMDEGYFLYFEDVDFCTQARRKGWRVVVQPNALVFHHGGASTGLDFLSNSRKPAYYWASRTRYFFKCYGFLYLTAANVGWSVGWLLSQARHLVVGYANPSLPDYGILDIWTNYLRPLGERAASRVGAAPGT